MVAGASEAIVVDGGSSDSTVAVAASTSAKVLNSDPGRAFQQNAGAVVAKGDVLLFLHADCRLHPDSVSQIRNTLSQAERCVGGCFRQAIDAAGRRYRWIESGNAWRARCLKWIYGDQALFVRRDVFERLDGFPRVRFLEDLYFAKRLKREGRLALLDPPLKVSARRWQQAGLVRQTLRNWAIVTAAHLGASPDWLAKFYPKAR